MNPEMADDCIDRLMEEAPALYHYAYARLKDHHLCQDLVQDALLAAWKSRDSRRGDSALLTWLTGILRNKILDHHRSHARRSTVAMPAGDGATAEEMFNGHGDWTFDPNHGMRSLMESPEAAAQNADLRRWIGLCMDKLPARLRLLFTARELDELSVAEAAAMAGVTEGSAAVLLTRTRHALRLCLQQSLNR